MSPLLSDTGTICVCYLDSDLLNSFLVPNLWSDEHREEKLRSYGLTASPKHESNPWKFIYDCSKSDIFNKYLDQIDTIEDFWHIDTSSLIRSKGRHKH